MIRTSKSVLMAACTVLAVLPSIANAQSAPDVSFNIQSQDLGTALTELARQSNREIYFSTELPRGKRAQQLHGEMPVEDALKRLLAGSGLTYRVNANGAIVVQKMGNGQSGGADYTVPPRESNDQAGLAADYEEIVVTAQKFQQRLRDVPISLSAVTGDRLQQQGATRFSDYAGYIPGLTFSPSSAAGDGQLNLRGVTTASSPSASTAIYVDEVPTTTHGTFGGSSTRPLNLFPYDLERVEILRGPQGTLYGDSTIGGLVKYVTTTANVNEFSAAAGLEAMGISGGDGIGGGARAMVNVPIALGVFALRVSGYYQKTPGYVANVETGEEGVNEADQRGLRVAARFTPTDAFSIDAQWLHNETDFDGLARTVFVPGTTRPLYGNYKDSYFLPNGGKNDFDFLSGTLRYDFGKLHLTSVTGYSVANREGQTDYTSGLRGFIDILTGGEVTDGIGAIENPVNSKKFSQEVRLESAQGQRLTWLFGAYYTKEKTDFTTRMVPYLADGTIFTELLEIYNDEVNTRYEDLSVFGNATYKVTDKWEVSGGLRHSWVKDEFNEKGTGFFLSGSPTEPFYDEIKTKNQSTTWSLTTRYTASDDLMMYARAASGFRAGGTNYTWPGVPKGYDPDRLISYEAGARADFLADKASIDLTLYYLDWKDLFILAYTEDEFAYSYQTNGGKATGLGMEFTGTLRPVRGLSLTATAAYTGLSVREDLPTIGAEDGDHTPTSPSWTGSFLVDYTVPVSGDWDLNLGGGVRWANHTYSRFVHDPLTQRLDGYAVADLNASISNDRWTLRGYVRNLTNDDTVVAAGSQNTGVQMEPRTIGVALDVRF